VARGHSSLGLCRSFDPESSQPIHSALAGKTVCLFGRWLRLGPRAISRNYKLLPLLPRRSHLLEEQAAPWLSPSNRRHRGPQRQRRFDRQQPVPPTLTNPSASPLSGATQFIWTPGAGSTAFWLKITIVSAAGSDVYSSGYLANTVSASGWSFRRVVLGKREGRESARPRAWAWDASRSVQRDREPLHGLWRRHGRRAKQKMSGTNQWHAPSLPKASASHANAQNVAGLRASGRPSPFRPERKTRREGALQPRSMRLERVSEK
jgi:hypothetical protein